MQTVKVENVQAKIKGLLDIEICRRGQFLQRMRLTTADVVLTPQLTRAVRVACRGAIKDARLRKRTPTRWLAVIRKRVKTNDLRCWVGCVVYWDYLTCHAAEDWAAFRAALVRRYNRGHECSYQDLVRALRLVGYADSRRRVYNAEPKIERVIERVAAGGHVCFDVASG